MSARASFTAPMHRWSVMSAQLATSRAFLAEYQSKLVHIMSAGKLESVSCAGARCTAGATVHAAVTAATAPEMRPASSHLYIDPISREDQQFQ